MNVLLWFTVDLRVQANAAVIRAASLGPVLPVYIVDPALWSGSDRSGRQWDFIAESLLGLRDDLGALGAPLAVRFGSTLQMLSRLAARYRCTHLVVGALTDGAEVDLRCWAGDNGITLHVASDTTPISDPQPPTLRSVPDVEPGPIPTARRLGLDSGTCPHRQLGGRRRADAVLATHLARAPAARTALFTDGERGTSRLSPYLSQGLLAPTEIAATVHEARSMLAPSARRRLGAGLLRGLEQRARLPPGPAPCDEAVAGQGDRFDAWRAGQTGLPFTDACLRYLAATGWLPHRSRALVLSVACHQLGLDWGAAGAHLAAMSTDYDPAIFWPLARAVVLGEAARPPRVPDPVAEGRAMDPTGALIRAWVPELKALSEMAIHAPWRSDDARGLLDRRYPRPLVDPVAATRSARAGGGRAPTQMEFAFPCPR